MRVRLPGEHSRVTNFELFFDLVFVFAVTQLSHTLAGHLTGDGLAQTTLLMLAVWWAWMYTAWATNWCDPDHLAMRLMLIAVMLGGLVMAASIPQAFDGRGFGFVLPYVAIQVGRSLFMIWATGEQERVRRTFIRITTWFAVSGILWVAGAFLHGDSRLFTWALALVFEYAGPSAGFWVPRLGRALASDWTVEGAHLAERCGLFVIIALGESLLVTGATFSEHAWPPEAVGAMAAAFAAAVGMWWLYFDVTAEVASERIAHAEVPGSFARLAYTYIHLPIVAGIIVTAVGDELALAHPLGETHLSTALALVGGPALFIAGYSLFKFAMLGRWFPGHFCGLAALVGIFALHSLLSPLATSAGTTVVVAALAVYGRIVFEAEQRAERRQSTAAAG